jgi:hypothetical protein
MPKNVILAISLLTLGIGLPAVAADVPIVRANQFEIGGLMGFSYGVDQSRVMGGGNVTYSVLKWLLPYAEYTYFPSIQRSTLGNAGGQRFKDVYDIPMTDVNFGVHMRVLVPHTRIVPYIVVGAGFYHFPRRVEQNYTLEGQNYSTKPNPGTSFAAGTNLAVNFGGGFRYYLNGEHFGLRAETKGYRLTSPPGASLSPFQSNPWVYSAAFGVFVQFGR